MLAELLNSEAARGFFRSFVFWDSKRPVTAQLLAHLDLGRLAAEARRHGKHRSFSPRARPERAAGRRNPRL